jgi:phospholipid transport system substrate-binding protein
MTRGHRALALAGLLVLASGVPEAVGAGEPTDQIRAQIDQLYQAVQQAAPSASGEIEAAKVLDQMFDWPRMAEAALGGHWPQRTAAERAEFTHLFARLFRRGYLSRIHLVDTSKFQYPGDVVTGDSALVKTQVFTKKGSTINVDYLTRLEEGRRWRVTDVQVERISLVGNYRTQFDAVVTRSSYEELVTKLRGAAK